MLNIQRKEPNRTENDGLLVLGEFSKCIPAWNYFDLNKDGILDAHEFMSVHQQLEYEILSYHELYNSTLKKAKKRKLSQVDNSNCDQGKNNSAREYVACSLRRNNTQFSNEEQNQLEQLKLSSRLLCN